MALTPKGRIRVPQGRKRVNAGRFLGKPVPPVLPLVASGMAQAISSTTGIRLPLSRLIRPGDVVIAMVDVNSTTDINVTNVEGTWTELAETYSNNTNDTNMGIYLKVMGAIPDTSVSFGGTASSFHWQACYMAFRGINNVTPLDVSVLTATGTTNGDPNAPANIPATVGALSVVCGASTQGDFATGFPSAQGYTDLVNIAGNASNVMMCYKRLTDLSAVDPTAFVIPNDASSDSWSAAHVILRPAA